MSIRSIGAYSRIFLGKLRPTQLMRLIHFTRPHLRPMDVVDIRRANLATQTKLAGQSSNTQPPAGECAKSNFFPYNIPNDASDFAGLVDIPNDRARSDNHLRVIEALEHPRNEPLTADQEAGRLDELA